MKLTELLWKTILHYESKALNIFMTIDMGNFYMKFDPYDKLLYDPSTNLIQETRKPRWDSWACIVQMEMSLMQNKLNIT